MKTMGFVISHKNGEKRRALLPEKISEIHHPKQLFFETGYGASISISDDEYAACGCSIVSREEALGCDIIADVKLGDADYLESISDNKTLFGWAHAVQGIDFTSSALRKKQTVIAWEELYEKGRYVFYRNREIAGEAAVLQGFRYCGKMPYDTKVAIIGNGQTAKGAMRVLHGLGADIDIYGRKHEKLFREKMFEYDVLINCVMWDTSRTDRIIYASDLKKMKPGTLIIDVSCDPHLEIETSHPTTIDNPVYEVNGVIHYAVDNTPAMFPISVSKVLSDGLAPYINMLIEDDPAGFSQSLVDSIVIKDGVIIDQRIRTFREARGLPCV